MSVENKCVDSGLPTAGMLLDLILGRPRWYLWGTPRTCPAVHRVPLADLLWDGHSAEEMYPGPPCCMPASQFLLLF